MYHNEEEGFSAPIVQNLRGKFDLGSSADKSIGDKKKPFGMFDWDWESSEGLGEGADKE